MIPHNINVLVNSFKDPVHLIYAVTKNNFFRFSTLRNELHIVFHLCTKVWLIEFNTKMLVGFDK